MVLPPQDRQNQSRTFVAQMLEKVNLYSQDCQRIQFGRKEIIYRTGENDDAVYVVVAGTIKLLIQTAREQCGLMEICVKGEVFGESCLSGHILRPETALAMGAALVLRIPRPVFLTLLQEVALLDGMARYMSRRIEERRCLIVAMLARKKQHRLALVLLYLARKFGKQNPDGTCLQIRILHEDLAEMTGMRRTRITCVLSRFRERGLIYINRLHQIVVREDHFVEYLRRSAAGAQYCLH